jgi:hypothetical protein
MASTGAPDKIIVTNGSALRHKYGTRANAVAGALKALIAADAKRHLTTALVDLADARQMARFGARPIPLEDVDSEKDNKHAIDAVCQALVPSYLMILGSTDVVPHQRLTNPLYHPDDDDDKTVPSDLPYACEAPFGRKIAAFRAPTRVVGRLPDLTGGRDPGYLVSLIRTACRQMPRPASAYDAAFGLTAEVWRSSTASSVGTLFAAASRLHVSPKEGPHWAPAALTPLSHFINCHGAPHDYRFYGQKGRDYPVSHDSRDLAGLREGTVLAAECCYGAELWNPIRQGGKVAMCNAYLAAGALAYLGSSTIAYGPASGNAQADLVCQYFFRSIRAGASSGRACLEARLGYVRHAGTLSPTDLKTLAQFNLMGDPSLTAIVAASRLIVPGRSGSKSRKAIGAAERSERLSRRLTLRDLARATSSTPYFSLLLDGRLVTGKKAKTLKAVAAKEGIEAARLVSFGPGTRSRGSDPARIHVVLTRDRRHDPKVPGIVRIDGLEMIELHGAFRTRRFHSR